MAVKKCADLLDKLCILADCCYLSDLHNPAYASATITALRGIFPGDYTLTEWNGALAYITGQAAAATPEEAVIKLIDFLEKR